MSTDVSSGRKTSRFSMVYPHFRQNLLVLLKMNPYELKAEASCARELHPDICVLKFDKHRVVPTVLLFLVTPVLAFGPAMHLHTHDHSSSEQHATVIHSCHHHGHHHHGHHHHSTTATHTHAPYSPPIHSHGPHDEDNCCVCQVLAQTAQTPETAKTTDTLCRLTWSLTLRDDQCKYASQTTLRTRGPPA